MSVKNLNYSWTSKYLNYDKFIYLTHIILVIINTLLIKAKIANFFFFCRWNLLIIINNYTLLYVIMKRNNSRITLNESEIICNIIKKKMYLRMILVISLQRSKYFGKYVFPYSSVDGKFQFPIKKKNYYLTSRLL